MVYLAQRLLLAGRLDDELAVTENAAPCRALEAHIRHLCERQHVHRLGENARSQQQALGSYHEVIFEPLLDP